MQSRCLNTNIAKSTFPAPHIEGARSESVRCGSGYSLVLCVINFALTVLPAWLTAPPPHLMFNKCYISQDRIAFRGVLFLSCLRVSSRTERFIADCFCCIQLF